MDPLIITGYSAQHSRYKIWQSAGPTWFENAGPTWFCNCRPNSKVKLSASGRHADAKIVNWFQSIQRSRLKKTNPARTNKPTSCRSHDLFICLMSVTQYVCRTVRFILHYPNCEIIMVVSKRPGADVGAGLRPPHRRDCKSVYQECPVR